MLDRAGITNESDQEMQADREPDNAGYHNLSLLNNPGITKTETTQALWVHGCEAT